MPLQVDQLRWMAAEHGGEPAYTQLATGTTLTFAAWNTRSDQAARGLVAAGVGRGERVLLHLDDVHLERWIISYAAIHKAGAVAVPTNVRLTARELALIVADAAPVAAITSTRLAPTVLDAIGPGRPAYVVAADDDSQWAELLVDDADAFPVVAGDDDLADIMYTSGTTGRPKGVAVRHRNTHMIANGEPRWSGDAWIHCSPLSTFAGISFVYNPMKMGMRGLYLPRFDVHAWIDAVERERPTSAFLVPAMVQLLLADERAATADLSSLTLLSIGSAPLAPVLHQAVAERVPQALVTNNYSMTEAGTAFTYLPPGEIAKRPGSVGVPLPPTKIRIADDDGKEVVTGEVGEVLIGVGEDHREYYGDTEATARTWSGPWLRSGDLGRVDDDGYLYIVGRAKDVVIRGGNNISATEVEHVLYEHDGVLEAAVVGVPHAVLGEDVGAFVVARGGRELDVDELKTFCAERLADYKVPRSVWVIDELPRNAMGKVVKADLVARLDPSPGERPMSALATLAGTRVLVTGASSGIGAALAPMLAERGATVGVVARRADRLATVVDACTAAGPDRGHRYWSVDLSDPDAAARVAIDAWDAFGGLDAVVNNAARPMRRPVQRLDVATVDDVMRTNFLSPVALSLAVLPRMLEADHGVIVNVSSMGGRLGIPNEAAYAASKFALSGWSESMAMDLWSTGVEVRLITPGAFATEIWDQPGNDAADYDGPFESPATAGAAICDALTGDGFETYVPDMKDVAEFKTSDIDAYLAASADFARKKDA